MYNVQNKTERKRETNVIAMQRQNKTKKKKKFVIANSKRHICIYKFLRIFFYFNVLCSLVYVIHWFICRHSNYIILFIYFFFFVFDSSKSWPEQNKFMKWKWTEEICGNIVHNPYYYFNVMFWKVFYIFFCLQLTQSFTNFIIISDSEFTIRTFHFYYFFLFFIIKMQFFVSHHHSSYFFLCFLTLWYHIFVWPFYSLVFNLSHERYLRIRICRSHILFEHYYFK